VQSPLGGALEHIVLRSVRWELYESLLEQVGDQNFRMTYEGGDLKIMSPLPEHEQVKITIGHADLRALPPRGEGLRIAV